MSVNKIVISALTSFGYPISQDTYDGDENTYFVWNYADERATLYKDDTPIIDVVSIQVHFYCTSTFNYLQIKKDIKNALGKAGFTNPTVPLQTIETDTMLRHIVFECEIEQIHEESEE